jgi:hypothetical protein
MFQTKYIYELVSGKLSVEGYKHIINTISFFVKKYNWPKSIIISSESNSFKYWSADDFKELTHQFFDWSLSKGKLEHLNKIPENYLSYYFVQILISFIANRINEEQQKKGLSFEKCRELVLSICKEVYIINTIEGNQYVFKDSFVKEDINHFQDMSVILSYLIKIPIKESTKHFRPLVKLAIEDIFEAIESPISCSNLTETVYNLFDQKEFASLDENDEISKDWDIVNSNMKFDKIIQNIVSGLTQDDAKMISHFLFHNGKEQSLAEFADFYGIAKSTLHYKIDSFKKKIASSYIPISETDGVIFIQHISKNLDKLSK